jgi:hypothetical protein
VPDDAQDAARAYCCPDCDRVDVEDAARACGCPHCVELIKQADAGKPKWWSKPLAVVGLIVVFAWLAVVCRGWPDYGL